MSKAAKLSVFILIFLLLVSLGFAGYTLMEKQKLEAANNNLNGELSSSQKREKDATSKIKQLSDEVVKVKEERDQVSTKLASVEKQSQDLLTQVNQITEERDKWMGRVDSAQKERDELLAKVKELNDQKTALEEQMAAAEKSKAPQQTTATPQMSASSDSSSDGTASLTTNSQTQSAPAVEGVKSQAENEQWASVLKQKAALEVELNNLKTELSKNAGEIVDLKQNNESLKVELDGLKHQKEQLDQDIKFKEDMVNNLSLELAKTKNDRKFISEQAGKLNTENTELRNQIKKLVTTKGSLEKSILHLTDDKNKIEKELGKSDTIIQSKIDEIWEIKDSIDKTFKDAKANQPVSNEVELPPIVVNADGPSRSFNSGMTNPGFSGKVVSINEDNNFVIVDIGEKSGITVGDALSVYRDSEYVARLEVIQVRKDISAADIKEQWSKIQVGDIVR